MFLLLWEWFRIYFESGVVKLESGDPTWRNLTAMYEYYQNGPLPTWIGWYLQHLPHWFHIATAALTLVMELVLVWMAFLPRRWKIACFFIVTGWQIGVIATANYAFLNYLVLILAVLLLDDAVPARFVPQRWRNRAGSPEPPCHVSQEQRHEPRNEEPRPIRIQLVSFHPDPLFSQSALRGSSMRPPFHLSGCSGAEHRFPAHPVTALEPFRIANQYGLFAVMTPHRYEIEFQGSNDGETLGCVSLPLQTAGTERSAAHLCAVPAAV